MAAMFSLAFLFSTYFHGFCIFHSTERENGFCEVLRSQVSFGSPRLPPSLGHRNEVPFFCWFTKSSGKVKLLLLPAPPPDITLCAFLSTKIRNTIFESLIWTIFPDFAVNHWQCWYQLRVEDVLFKEDEVLFKHSDSCSTSFPLKGGKNHYFFSLWLHYSRLRKAWFIKVLNVEAARERLC